MFLNEPTQDVGLDDRKSLGGPFLQIFLDFRAIHALKREPDGVAKIEERFAILIDEISAILADPQLHALDRSTDFRALVFAGLPNVISISHLQSVGRRTRSEQPDRRNQQRAQFHGAFPRKAGELDEMDIRFAGGDGMVR